MEEERSVVMVEFPNAAMAEAFLIWLCEVGEQSYFEHDDPNVASQLTYHFDELRATAT